MGVPKLRVFIDDVEAGQRSVIRRFSIVQTGWVRVEIPCWVGEIMYSPKSTVGYLAFHAVEGATVDSTVSTDGRAGDGFLTVAADSYLTAPVKPGSWLYIAGTGDLSTHELLMTAFRGSTDASV